MKFILILFFTLSISAQNLVLVAEGVYVDTESVVRKDSITFSGFIDNVKFTMGLNCQKQTYQYKSRTYKIKPNTRMAETADFVCNLPQVQYRHN